MAHSKTTPLQTLLQVCFRPQDHEPSSMALTSEQTCADTILSCAGFSRIGSVQLGVLVPVQRQAKAAEPSFRSPKRPAAGHCDAPGPRKPEVQQQVLAGRAGRPRLRQSLTKCKPLSGSPIPHPNNHLLDIEPTAELSMTSSPPQMQLQRMGTALVFVQPMEDGKASGSSVMIELQSGKPYPLSISIDKSQ